MKGEIIMSEVGRAADLYNARTQLKALSTKDGQAKFNTAHADAVTDEINSLGFDGFASNNNLQGYESFDDNGVRTMNYYDSDNNLVESAVFDPASGGKTSLTHYEGGKPVNRTDFDPITGQKTNEVTLDPDTGDIVIISQYQDGNLLWTGDTTEAQMNELSAEIDNLENQPMDEPDFGKGVESNPFAIDTTDPTVPPSVDPSIPGEYDGFKDDGSGVPPPPPLRNPADAADIKREYEAFKDGQ